MKVDVDVLERALTRVIAHLRCASQADLQVDQNMYWFIQKSSLNDVTCVPSEQNMSLGDLEDDWKELLALANSERDPIGYDLVWLSAVLRSLGDRIP